MTYRIGSMPRAILGLAAMGVLGAPAARAQGPLPLGSLRPAVVAEPGMAPPGSGPAAGTGFPAFGLADSLACRDCDPPKRFWAGFGELMLVQVIPHFVNATLRDAEWAEVSWQSIENNLTYPWQWDDNQFINNQFSHPYHGNLYFNAARTNGYDFWESFAWPFAGSLMWEVAGEAWAPAPNDFLNTSFGGVTLGEVFYRLSSLTLDNSATGSERTWREIGAFVLNPIRGFNRLVRGETHGVSANPPDWRPSRIVGVLDVGYRRTSNTFSVNGFEDGADQWDANLSLMYGDASKDLDGAPFSYFLLGAELAGPPVDSARRLNRFQARGSLAAWPLGRAGRHQLAMLLAYDFVNNPAVEFGGQSVQAGIVSTFGQPGGTWWGQTHALLDGIIIGATQSDYYTSLEGRNYDYGPGLGGSFAARVVYKRRLQAGATYAGWWIHTVDGAESAHYQDALTAEARYWLTDRLGAGFALTGYSRHSDYADFPDVSQSASFLRVFASTAFPGMPQ